MAYNYTPSKQVDLQREMAQALMGTPMRQGLNPGQKTDWGRGLAHMLRQYQGNKSLNAANETEAKNAETHSSELAAFLRAAGNADNLSAGNGPMRLVEDMEFSSPGVQEAQTSRILRGIERKEAQADKMAQIGAAGDQQRQTAKEAPYSLPSLGMRFNGGGSELSRNEQVRPPSYGSGNGTPYYTPIPTPDGVRSFNNRTGTLGDPTGVVRSQDSPELQGNLSQSKAGGKVVGTTTAERDLASPGKVAGYDDILGSIDKLQSSEHREGFNSTFGAVEGWLPTLLPSTQNAEAYVQQVADYLSIENREKMQGSGAISDFEAKTLASAATILNNRKVSDDVAWDELGKVRDILERAREKHLRYQQQALTPRQQEMEALKAAIAAEEAAR
ncbi:hypothetical protein OAA60_00715 [Porticoccaceae bacterium]|nr:hypothetical protein [Porticoccaceae bacterium]